MSSVGTGDGFSTGFENICRFSRRGTPTWHSLSRLVPEISYKFSG
jgi:hypothetical protein